MLLTSRLTTNLPLPLLLLPADTQDHTRRATRSRLTRLRSQRAPTSSMLELPVRMAKLSLQEEELLPLLPLPILSKMLLRRHMRVSTRSSSTECSSARILPIELSALNQPPPSLLPMRTPVLVLMPETTSSNVSRLP